MTRRGLFYGSVEQMPITMRLLKTEQLVLFIILFVLCKYYGLVVDMFTYVCACISVVCVCPWARAYESPCMYASILDAVSSITTVTRSVRLP